MSKLEQMAGWAFLQRILDEISSERAAKRGTTGLENIAKELRHKLLAAELKQAKRRRAA
jgi:hypothetical protein